MKRGKVSFVWWMSLIALAGCGKDSAESAVPSTEKEVGAVVEQQGPPKRIFARKHVVKVREAADKQSFRLGYLRAGAVLMSSSDRAVGNESCLGGWYPLETGGFVCNRRDVIAFEGSRLPERQAAQPKLDEKLPYVYGYNRKDGTPMYKRLPDEEEAMMYEGYVPPSAPPPVSSETSQAIELSTGESAKEETAPPTLDSLKAERESVLQRHLVRGFIVSLDREMEKGARKYWRTLSNGFIPYKRMYEMHGSDFRGKELNAETGLALPLAVMMSDNYLSYRLDDKQRLRRGAKPGYHTFFPVLGKSEHGGRVYYESGDGVLLRDRDLRLISIRDKPEEVADNEKWIDVDLNTQSLVAYVGETPVFATLVSTGRVMKREDPLRNHETPTGSFRITSKHLSATMDGDHAVDGPYSIEDVPYVMYFQLAYAFHSAFWHNRFGKSKSHGCINLAPWDARFLFNWAEPKLPAGWHGVFPKDDLPGTRVYIRGETEEG
ncbi:MAG: L,D-transpeptidase [Myxococcales bacterium]|nr:MAG: L,D-transpeptidase [Myxococcales bacterium]